MLEIERVIAYYEKQSDKFVDEYVIEIDLDILSNIWIAYEGDPLYYKIYPVGEGQRVEVEKILCKKLEFEKYDYFLECHSV